MGEVVDGGSRDGPSQHGYGVGRDQCFVRMLYRVQISVFVLDSASRVDERNDMVWSDRAVGSLRHRDEMRCDGMMP